MSKNYCAFIIWGNGIKYSNEIINSIRENKNIKILKIIFHETNNIKKFIKQVYSKDYAPFKHLKAKTKYLLKSEKKIHIIFVINKNPQEQFFGEGNFRHIACKNIKILKENIRKKYNPKNKEGKMTHEHVIHSTDSEYQVDHLLKILGYTDGIKNLSNKSNKIITSPYHIKKFNNFTIKKVNINSIYCKIFKGTKRKYSKELKKINETPHYQYIIGNKKPYKEYINNFRGYLLTDDHEIKNFKILEKNFIYLTNPFELSYILIKEYQLNKYIIVDGIHRACLLKKQGKNNIISAII